MERRQFLTPLIAAIQISLMLLASGCTRRTSHTTQATHTVVSRDTRDGITVVPNNSEHSTESKKPTKTTVGVGNKTTPSQRSHDRDDQDEAVRRQPIQSKEHKTRAHSSEPLVQPVNAHYSMALEDRMVKINFENEDLATMVNHFAALQKQNLVLPQGADTLQQKITFKLPYEIPLREVNKYLDSFLDLAGYSRIPYGAVYRIVKNDATVARELLPLYVGVEPRTLPNSDERIRYIYYFKNLHVPDNEQGQEPITAILTSMLSSSRSILYDPNANAVILADKANAIRSAMTLLAELDAIGAKGIIRAIPLYNSTAETVAALMAKQILASGGEEQGGPQTARSDSGRYFNNTNMKIFADPRTNSLLVMGREPAVERLQDFVREYIDIPADTGNSILHFYNLQYLDAEKFAPVLQKIVAEQAMGSGQSTQQGPAGVYRFFDSVIVVPERMVAEKVNESKAATSERSITSILKGSVYRGGNRIVVTALNDDWKRIEKLIQQLDKPRLQVIIQVLVVDFSVTNNEILASQLRNPEWMQLPKGVAFQSAQLLPPILDGPIVAGSDPTQYTNPTTVAADLLRLLGGGISAAAGIVNDPANIGSMIVSFNDPSTSTPGIWCFMQWLQKFFTTKILSHPYIVTQNHAKGEEYISSIKRLPGPVSTGEGGAQAIRVEDVEAAVKVSVVPRASSVERLNLQISIELSKFTSTSGTNRTTRELHTDVNIGSGETLVLGGLTEYDDTETESGTPILDQVPFLRWFFSAKEKTVARSNLIVFVSPTVVEPRIRAGMNEFTKNETRRNYHLMRQDELLSQFKDPVSILFFNEQNDDLSTMLDEYLSTGKGDFVFDEVGPVKTLSSHHCDEEAKEIDPATAAAELKRQLASEENPLLPVQNTPKKNSLTRAP